MTNFNKNINNSPFKLGTERQSKATGKKVRDYVDNEIFTKAIITYNIEHNERMARGLPKKIMPDIIGHGILKIVDGLGSRFNFRGYTYIDEMRDDAIVQAVYAVTKFKVDKLTLSYLDEKRWYVNLDPKHYNRTKKTKEEEDLFQKWKKKNPSKVIYGGVKIKEPNAFGYINLICWRSFTARIKEEAEQQQIIEDLMMDPNYICYQSDMNHNDINIDISKENAVDFYFDGK